MLEVSIEQTLLSWRILRRAPGGVTPSTIPYMTDENLAKAHRTPSVTCGPPLWSLSRSFGENPLRSQPGMDRKRHDTYILHYALSDVWAPCRAYHVPLARNPWDLNLAWITRDTAPTSFIIVLVLNINERLNLYMLTHLPRIRDWSD
jgi:hypothetical protein